MRALDDHVLDPKRAALKLYALQIAASNLKRLHEETMETTNAADMVQEKSLMKELLEALQLPETEAERMAEEMAAERERENAPSDTLTIKACASNRGQLPGANRPSPASTFVPFEGQMPLNAPKYPCYTFSISR